MNDELAGHRYVRATPITNRQPYIQKTLAWKCRNHRQPGARAAHEQLHPQNDFLPVVIVRYVARGEDKQKHRRHLHQAHETQIELGMSPLINFPAHRHGQRLLRKRTYEPPDQIKHKIPVSQNCVGILVSVRSRRFL